MSLYDKSVAAATEICSLTVIASISVRRLKLSSSSSSSSFSKREFVFDELLRSSTDFLIKVLLVIDIASDPMETDFERLLKTAYPLRDQRRKR